LGNCLTNHVPNAFSLCLCGIEEGYRLGIIAALAPISDGMRALKVQFAVFEGKE
jgi:hypothetical protein